MKKTLTGIGLIVLAVAILFRDQLSFLSYGMPLWRLALIVFFGVETLQNAFRKDVKASFIGLAITFILLNGHFQWLQVGTGTLIIVAVLLYFGFSMILKPKEINMKYYKGKKGKFVGWTNDPEFKESSDTVFGNATRYVNDDNFVNIGGDVVFSGTSIYFDQAIILGDTASYSGDATFSSVKLFVPRNWKVEFTGDRVFSSIEANPSGLPTDKTLVVSGDYVFSRLTVYYI